MSRPCCCLAWNSLTSCSRRLQLFRFVSSSSNFDQRRTLVKETASVVVIGGGAVGTSLAYHLAKAGLQDVVLLEKTELTAGSTWHALLGHHQFSPAISVGSNTNLVWPFLYDEIVHPGNGITVENKVAIEKIAGLTTYYHPGVNMKKFHYNSIKLYSQLEEETGQDIGFHCPGSIRLATTSERMDEFRYQMQRNNWHANPQSMIEPNELAKLCPILNMDGILGGLYNPEDGHVDPYSLTHALAIGAKKYGATVQTNCTVVGLKQVETGEWQVDTSLGALKTKHVVNAAGFWAHEVGRMVGIELPLIPIHHQYLVTNPVKEVAELPTEFPVLRDLEGSYYLRQERDGLLVGPYESAENMRLQEEWVESGVPPGFGKELFDSDLDRISDHLAMAAERVPSFANAGISQVICGPIMYSPDSLPMVGPWQGLSNFWLSCGFGYGIIHAGGAGRYLANWIINGEPPYQLIEVDPVRYGKWTTRTYTAVKARESYGMNTALGYPKEERPVGRPARVSGAYDAMKCRGAEFGFHSGWEQPNWFALPGDEGGYMPSFRTTNWFVPVHRESELVRKRVGVIDLSPFGKLEVKGRDSASFIDSMFANKVPKVGRTNISHMVTPSGRTCSEMTISHLTDDHFFLVTGSGSERHDQRWLEQHLPSDGDVTIVNVTDDYGCLGIAGPLSRDVMASLTSTPMGNKEFPFLNFQNILLKGIPVLAIRVSYTGELGWELHHKSQYTHDLYKALLDEGKPFGIGDFGTYAMGSLRLEKGFRAWGAEMSMDSTPLEAKLDPFIKLKKTAEFIGKGALLKQKADGLTQELAFLTVDTRDTDPEGNETIWLNDKVVGYTTSGGFGYEVRKSIAFGYVPCELARPGSRVQVELLGELRDAEVVQCPMVEPEHMRNRKR